MLDIRFQILDLQPLVIDNLVFYFKTIKNSDFQFLNWIADFLMVTFLQR